MSLKNLLFDDLKIAMKQKDILAKNVITLLRAELKQIEVDERREVEDDEIISIIQKQIKVKQKAITDFEKGNRSDLVFEANSEIDILKKYLPEQISVEEAQVLIENIIKELNATSIKDMGRVIGVCKERMKNSLEMSKISNIVKQLLIK